jgi:aspartyl-tRNA synthetase
MTLEIVKEIAESAGAKPGDLVLIVAGTQTVANNALSALRTEIAQRLGLIDAAEFKFAWIYDFPLFEWDEDEKSWAPAHHVFSAPKEEHIPFIESDPGKVYADLFDLTCNGIELGSGSIRIYDPQVQAKVFSVIGYPDREIEERFGHLLKAFRHGAPPHGGMGLGLDRFVAMLAGQSSIREVIAFPKTQSAWDPLFDAPVPIADEQLDDLGITLNVEE